MSTTSINQNGQPDNIDDRINLADLLDHFLRYGWLIAIVFGVVLALGTVYAIVATPIYQADALIQVEDKKPTMLSGVQEIADALGAASSPVSGEIEILRSREVVMKALEETRGTLRVAPRYFPVFGEWFARKATASDGVRKPILGLRAYAWGGEVLQVDEFDIPVSGINREFRLVASRTGFSILNEDGDLLAEGRPGVLVNFEVEGKAARIFVKELRANDGQQFTIVRVDPLLAYRDVLARLNVSETGKQSGIIRLRFQDSDVNYAQALVNAIAKAYLKQNVERRSAEADQSLKFLEEQLPEIRRTVERAENALTAYRTKSSTISIDKSADTLLNRAVEVEKQRLSLQLKRDQLRQQFRPEHPELRAIEEQLASAARETEKVNVQVNQLPSAQRDLLRLQRDAEVSSQIYLALLNNVQQLKVAKAGTVGNVRIIDFALKDPVPVAPKRLAIVLGSALLGLVLGSFITFVARILRPTIRDAAEIERATGLVVYATVPESARQEKLDSSKRDTKGRRAIVEGRSQLLAVLQPDDPAIESLRSLRTGLSFAILGASDKNIVITGATAGLGKSFISANLSVLLASTGKKVLLVETDMRRPQLGAYFGYGTVPGLSDLLANKVRLEDVIRSEEFIGGSVDILPAGHTPPNPGELLLRPNLKEIVLSLQDRYDHIVFDSAPVLPVGDTLAVARCASTTFLVVRAEQSTVGEVRDALKKLSAAGIDAKGLIFNGVKRRRVGYGYAYKYYYGYGSDA